MRSIAPSIRSFLAFALFLALIPSRAAAQASQILEIASDSLTSYRYTGNTVVQGVRPQYNQRGVTIDGAMRSAPAYPMVLAGNPFENAWTGREKDGALRVDLGAYAPQDIDIALPTDGIPWVIGRTYNALQLNSGGSNINSNGYQGKNWFQTSQPEIRFYDDATNTKDLIYLVYGADRYVEFARAGNSSNQFKGKNGAAGGFNHVTGSPDTYVYTDQHGNEWTFFGFNTSGNTTDGQFWKVTTPNAKTSFVGDASTASSAISNGYSGGKITTAYDASDRRFSYTYTTLNGTSRLTLVKAETKTGGSWSSPSGVATAVQVDYSYYSDANESHGDIGDLKQVKITTRLNDSTGETIEQVKRKHYRYWEGSADDTASYNASTNPGYPHALKYIYDFEGVRVYDWNLAGDHDFDEDHLGATDSTLESYAAAYFEYDSSHRVRAAWFDGQCGCGGGSDGAFAYTYGASGYTNDPVYDNEWATRTVVARPDGSFLTQYFDEVGQGLSQVISDADPSGASSKWVTLAFRDTDGRVTRIHTPENLNTYTHSSGAIDPKTTDTGLVSTFARATSGNMTGFVTDEKHQLGWDPNPPTTMKTKYFDASQTFTNLTKTITDVTVVRPEIATAVEYSQEISSGSSGAYTTSFSYTAHSGQALAIETITRTNPTVSSGNNGSNSSTLVYEHYRKDGLIDFRKNEDQAIEYWGYGTTESKYIEDANTSHADFSGVTVPQSPIDFDSSGTALHRKTTTTFTSQGHPLLVTTPQKSDLQYLTRLADHRLVELRYADYVAGIPSFYSPVRYTVYNQAGKPEFEGVIGHSAKATSEGQDTHIGETTADPILAVAKGGVDKMRTNVYTNTGHELTESRVYFSIPSSGAGTEGTHYDATRFAYDDSGRRIRTKEPSGTIRRSTHDLFGRVTVSAIGTNDNGLPGGESSGSSNMVTTETREYDDATVGMNGSLTKIARYTTSSAHDDTTFKYDYRGRMIVELPPLSPFTVQKPDNMGRVIARGQYSSSSGLDASDDPTSLTTNRMALSQTFFDERGQVWKSQRHKIDDADGSDDDTLQTLDWYDSRGRLVKTDGSQLSKTKYDRLGRVTDVYVLAIDDDTGYSDADDVAGDIVLEENQTRYDTTTGTVILEARIDRFHTDYGTSETEGALDANADGGTPNALKLSAADLEGRVQITAKWYDSLENLEDQVEYGTNNGSDFDRNGLSVPTRSDTALRTTWSYTNDGSVDTTTDPKGLVTKFMYDAAGRIAKEIKHYDAGVNSGNPSGTDDNVTIAYEYSKGLRTKIKADLPSGETDQETIYIYGSTKDTPSQMKIATGHLLRAVKYPDTSNGSTTVANIDSDSSDVVSFAYNAQSRQVYKQDQAGNILQSDYDANGRGIHTRVTTIASGFDSKIRRMSTTYDSVGRVLGVTQYDNATVGSGSAQDDIKYAYDDWGVVANYGEDRTPGSSGDEYTTSYTWAKRTSGRNTLRLTAYTLPSGRTIDLQYRTTSGLHDGDASRVTIVADGAAVLARYWYNGVGQVVGQEYDQPDVVWRMYGSTGTYPDLDGFNRVVASRWTKDFVSSPPDFDLYSVALAYDRNSNITSADDSVHAGFDVLYSMDDMNRVTRAHEGTLLDGTISTSTDRRDQQWTLTHTGNWELDKVDLNGDDDYVDTNEVNDDRTHNAVNELTARDTDDNGSDNFTLTYDAVGNMTDDGQTYEYEYDAFYRLRKVKNTTNQALIAEYRYNGLGHRIGMHEDTEPDGDVDANDKWYYDAFDERWRHLARYRDSDTFPKEDFVPHQAGPGGSGASSYIDLVICRNKDADEPWKDPSDGDLEERTYYCQNWRADASALVKMVGAATQIREWVKYSAYGIPCALPLGDADSDGDADAADESQVQTWINGSLYYARGDTDLDGDVDSADKAAIAGNHQALGRNVLSSVSVANRLGFGGCRLEPMGGRSWDVRHRVLFSSLGRWNQRDSEGYIDSMNLMEYVGSMPTINLDPTGEFIFNYGCFCGLTRRASMDTDCEKESRDRLDYCCCLHDKNVGQYAAIGGQNPATKMSYYSAGRKLSRCLERPTKSSSPRRSHWREPHPGALACVKGYSTTLAGGFGVKTLAAPFEIARGSQWLLESGHWADYGCESGSDAPYPGPSTPPSAGGSVATGGPTTVPAQPGGGYPTGGGGGGGAGPSSPTGAPSFGAGPSASGPPGSSPTGGGIPGVPTGCWTRLPNGCWYCPGKALWCPPEKSSSTILGLPVGSVARSNE